MLSLILASIISLSGNVGQAPFELTVKVRPPNGVVCIQVWDKEVVGGEIDPVRQSCWIQDKLDPPVESRKYTLDKGVYKVIVSANNRLLESTDVIVTEENPSNQTVVRPR